MTDSTVTVTSNITIPSLSTASVNIPISINLDLTTLAAQVAAILNPPVVAPPPPPTTAPALVYENGQFYWPGDYSWGVSVHYQDTNGIPISGPYDVSVSGNGGWQPYAPNFDFDPSPYTHLIFSVKPTLADIVWGSGVMAKGDIAVGTTISNLSTFAQGPIGKGIWTTYKIPLGAGGLNIPSGTHIYKFWIQDRSNDGSGTANNLWYVDNAYFQ